jgi:hypothetical protein
MPASGSPGCTALDSFGPLVVRQLALAAELHAVGHGAFAAFASALADQVALEVGNGS